MMTIQVTYLGDRQYRLQAHYEYQLQSPDGRVVGGHAYCDHVLKKHARAHMTFTKISGKRGDTVERAVFESSYRLHRIKAVLLQWQAHMDTLSGDSSGLQELVMPEMEFHGLIAAKVDHSKPRDGVVTDFKEMKGMLAGTDGSEDTRHPRIRRRHQVVCDGPLAAQAQYPPGRRVQDHAARRRALRRRCAVRLVCRNLERRARSSCTSRWSG